MSTICDIDQAGNVVCTYTESEKEGINVVCLKQGRLGAERPSEPSLVRAADLGYRTKPRSPWARPSSTPSCLPASPTASQMTTSPTSFLIPCRHSLLPSPPCLPTVLSLRV